MNGMLTKRKGFNMQKLFLTTALTALFLAGNALAVSINEEQQEDSSANQTTTSAASSVVTPSTSPTSEDDLDTQIEALRKQAEQIALQREALEAKKEEKRKAQELEALHAKVTQEQEALKALQAEQEAEEKAAAVKAAQEREEAEKKAKSLVGKADPNYPNYGVITEEDSRGGVKFANAPSHKKDFFFYKDEYYNERGYYTEDQPGNPHSNRYYVKDNITMFYGEPQDHYPFKNGPLRYTNTKDTPLDHLKVQTIGHKLESVFKNLF
jgi:transcription-repair coupling factor (superfamily II helicase)